MILTKNHIPIDTTSPLKATQKKLHSPKVWIFFGLTIFSYGLMFYTLFGKFLALKSMIFVMFFFLFFHFLYLEIRKLPIKYLLLFMIVLSIFQGFFVGYTHLWLVGSIFAINIGIVYFARFLQGESHDKTFFSSQGYFNVGGYMFTVFITIAYSFFVIGYYEKFPFTCQGLSQASNSVIDSIAKPFRIGLEEVKNLKNTTELFFKSRVTDLTTIEIQHTTQEPTFFQKLNDYKKKLIDQAYHDNTTVNMGICDYVLSEINKIYSTPGFKTSVIVLMFLLFYGFIRIEFWIMTGFAIILFKLLFALKIYRIKKVMKEVEELE